MGEKAPSAGWTGRPVLSVLIRAAALAVPIIAGVATSVVLSVALPQPRSVAQAVVWWIVVFGSATLVLWGVDTLARRLIPLATLLRLTLVFPDRAPSRYRVALRSGSSVGSLTALRSQSGEGAEAAAQILTLASALNRHDRMTRGHAERVRAYVDLIAKEMHISSPDRNRLRWGALLHDIGKLEIPGDILNKTEALTDDEWELLQQHPNLGMRVAAPLVPWLGRWADTIAHHHERHDGKGYPRGLAGEGINQGARIVAVADAFDVMTSARSYNRPMSAVAARAELQKDAGRQFDPAVVRALFNVSIGRLRWIIGPISWLAQTPILADFHGMTRWFGSAFQTAAGAAAVMLAVGAGLVGFPLVTEASEPMAVGSSGPAVSADDTAGLPPGGNSPNPPVSTEASSPPTSSTLSPVIASTSTLPAGTTLPPANVPTTDPAPATSTTEGTDPTTSSSSTTPTPSSTTSSSTTSSSTTSSSTTSSTTSSTAPATTTTALPSIFIVYLHNDPTPPTGDTSSHSVLPMSSSAPTASLLNNYDTDRDSDPGLLVQKTGEGLSESASTKHQIWSASISSDLDVQGEATLRLWSSIKDFDPDKKGEVLARLMECDASGSACNTIAQGSLGLGSWNGGTADWVSRTINLGSVDTTVVGGRTLLLKIVVGDGSDDDLWFAYDTGSFASRLKITP